MKKSILIIIGVVLLIAVVGYFVYPLAAKQVGLAAERWTGYRQKSAFQRCVNSNETTALIGVRMTSALDDSGDNVLVVLVFYSGTTREEAYRFVRHVLQCAINSYDDWQAIVIYDVVFKPVETFDDGQLHMQAIVRAYMFFPYSWAKLVADSVDLMDVGELVGMGMVSGEITIENVLTQQIPVPPSAANGDIKLVMRRWQAVLEKYQSETTP